MKLNRVDFALGFLVLFIWGCAGARIADLLRVSQTSPDSHGAVLTKLREGASPTDVFGPERMVNTTLFSEKTPRIYRVGSVQMSTDKRSLETNPWVEWIDVAESSSRYKKRAAGADPQLSDQWHLPAVNYEGARGLGLSGQGVKLRINDDGIFTSASDVVVDISTSFNYVTNVQDPTPPAISDCFSEAEAYCAHGTFCASIAAGRSGNSYCGSGVAPGAILSGAAVIGYSSRTTIEDIANALLADVDVVSNSWGLSGCETRANPFVDGGRDFPYCILAQIPNILRDAIETAARDNRGGRGTVFILAGGNTGDIGDNTNYQDFARLRQVITVGSTTRESKIATYSSPGAGVLLVAPGGSDRTSASSEGISGIFSSTEGYFSSNDTPSERCTELGSGTSWSAPIVGGAIALMMERNPSLSWRDVQHILVRSSRRIDSSHPSWARNGAGFFFSEYYGFGLLDVSQAVDFAARWAPVPTEVSVTISASRANLPIASEDGQMTRSMLLVEQSMIGDLSIVEHVEIVLDIRNEQFGNSYPGLYFISLTSPSGSTSVFSRPRAHLGTESDPPLRDFRLLSRAHWGENIVGSWFVDIQYDPRKLIDLCVTAARQKSEDPSLCQPDPRNNPAGMLMEWNITFYGPKTDPSLSTLNMDLIAAQQVAEVRRLSSQGGWSERAGAVSANYGNLVATVAGADETVVSLESANKPPIFSGAELSAVESEAVAPVNSGGRIEVGPFKLLFAIFYTALAAV